MLEDRILIWRFNRGDTAALCRIYERYRDDLLKVAAALLNDKSGIEDVLHDVFVDFAQSTGRFRLTGSLKGYLAICVANRARDRNRTASRRHDVASNKIEQPPSEPVRTVMDRELVERIDLVMNQLPPEQRETVVLHLQGRLRFREIAKLKGISVNTALSRYRYGLSKLRAAFNGELEP